MDDIFAVLAEPNRRLILDLLRDRERTVGDLVQALDIEQSGVSRHLRLLREHGLVDVEPRAQHRIYRLDPRALRAVDAWLEPYRAFWERHLDDLEQYLDTMEDR